MKHIEREIKIKLISPNIEELEKILNNKYKLFNEEHQIDIYYNSPVRDFRKTDEALRLRLVNNEVELTYKGPKLSSESKSREEITVKIDNLDSMDLILRKLGFVKVLKIEKIRKNYKINNFTISLDRVFNLGDFVEIEGIDITDEELINFVNNFLKEYNIEGEKTLKSYLELLVDKLEKESNSNTY
ncbi:class IV adenylate cyclase [Sulfolobus sp. S-194]|uniref:class IV adenylate cyclase n=1 Tax=Sulfolobus sp. S-194 TaxID=2512240 RepID=UPI00143739D9|nr:class IV adenylate cyclase [Sulfolobus sp. S-194]QIW23134.1 class IV adenylate cyclase [Sulfolobus sp. S-194]